MNILVSFITLKHCTYQSRGITLLGQNVRCHRQLQETYPRSKKTLAPLPESPPGWLASLLLLLLVHLPLDARVLFVHPPFDALLYLLLLALLVGGRPEGEGPERPPGLLDVGALALPRAVLAVGLGAFLLERAVGAVAARAV